MEPNTHSQPKEVASAEARLSGEVSRSRGGEESRQAADRVAGRGVDPGLVCICTLEGRGEPKAGRGVVLVVLAVPQEPKAGKGGTFL
jgi:hypothetical protein